MYRAYEGFTTSSLVSGLWHCSALVASLVSAKVVGSKLGFRDSCFVVEGFAWFRGLALQAIHWCAPPRNPEHETFKP